MVPKNGIVMSKLTALKVEQLTKLGAYGDGSGLYLIVDRSGKRWSFRYTKPSDRKRVKMSLGVYSKRNNSLADAREAASEARKLLRNSIDPKVHRASERESVLEEARVKDATQGLAQMTFGSVAYEWHERKKSQWRNEKHRNQNINTLIQYAFPYFGDKPVAEISLSDIKRCLDPIWEIKTETASRVRSRLESVLSYATINGYRTQANPAIWRGQLDQIYPQPEKLKKLRHEREGTSEHHKALPYEEIPDFYSQLLSQRGVGAVALQFCILTVTRTGSIRFAKWEQVDLDKKIWTIPASHMKTGSEFRVALSDAAIEILTDLKELDDYIFPGGKIGKALSGGGMSSVLKRMGVTNATVHGFRSTFRDYIGEATQLDPIIAEHCLAHRVGDATERAYARGDMLEKRFNMLNIWADYLISKNESN